MLQKKRPDFGEEMLNSPGNGDDSQRACHPCLSQFIGTIKNRPASPLSSRVCEAVEMKSGEGGTLTLPWSPMC